MQATARVNRVFRGKPAELIMDYIGTAQSLKSALSQYSRDDQEHVGIDEAGAVTVMLEKYETRPHSGLKMSSPREFGRALVEIV